MPYQVPRSKRSLKQNQFEFTIDGDTEPERIYSVPLMQFITPSVLRDLAELDMNEFFIRFMDLELPGVLEKLEGGDQLTDLLTAWQADSKLSMGESEGSPLTSPTTTAQSATSSSESATPSTSSTPAISAG